MFEVLHNVVFCVVLRDVEVVHEASGIDVLSKVDGWETTGIGVVGEVTVAAPQLFMALEDRGHGGNLETLVVPQGCSEEPLDLLETFETVMDNASPKVHQVNGLLGSSRTRGKPMRVY